MRFPEIPGRRGRTLADAAGRIGMVRSLVLLLLLAAPLSFAETLRYERGDQLLEIELRSQMSSQRRTEVEQWVQEVADALTLVFGRWPRDHWRVRVSTYDAGGRDPVPWGQVNRGDPDVVSFYIDPGASGQQLRDNWTAYHELSHLLIPYRGWGDMWFSEGLASYYQNLLQARHGVFDEREMWQRLYEGFTRGQTNHRPDLSLAQLSPRMRENRSFMRVYWSGAWYLLSVDIELRRRSGGEQSLDTALAALNRCCADASMSARSIATRLDSLTGEELFMPMFRQAADSYELPRFEERFAALGIEVVDGEVRLDETHPQAQLRRAIARP